jgi:hypothetical protein
MKAHGLLPRLHGHGDWPHLFHHTRDAELPVERQIERLFRRAPGTVWELLDPACPHRATDLPIRAADGTVVAYAHPDAA